METLKRVEDPKSLLTTIFNDRREVIYFDLEGEYNALETLQTTMKKLETKTV